ncbi:MAG: DUF1697 domain-containing protein [Prolixibacteraceae bacterium]|nr:DUF1697 domain-containing protein [Prolixibacteraceae bacterium]
MRYIAILRGINVGTGRKVSIADLKKLCESFGLSNVLTYIQSGNLVFELMQLEPISELEIRLQKAFSEAFGFEIPVLIRTSEEWAASTAKNPFLKEENMDIERLHLTCLKELPSPELLEKIKAFQYLPDRYEIIGRDVFIFCAAGYGTSKLVNSFFESKLKTSATTRNWKTVMQLNERAKSNI